MADYIKDYISCYNRCQYFKVGNIVPASKLQSLKVPHMFWVDVTANFTTNLPLSNGLKEVKFIPYNKIVTALDMAKFYLHNIWKNHGLLRSIVSDHSLQFVSQLIKDLCTWLGIKSKLSMAYYPQMDRQTKHINWDLQQYLWLFTTVWQHKWVDWLPLTQFFYNSKQ